MVAATDASLAGYGVCWSNWGREAVAAAGRVSERSRFRRGSGRSARDEFFEANVFFRGPDGTWSAIREDLQSPANVLRWDEVPNFREVDLRLLQK